MSRSSVPCGKSNRSEPMPSFPFGFDTCNSIAALVEVQEESHRECEETPTCASRRWTLLVGACGIGQRIGVYREDTGSRTQSDPSGRPGGSSSNLSNVSMNSTVCGNLA